MPKKSTYTLLIVSIVSTLLATGFLLFGFNFINKKNKQAVELSLSIQEKVNQDANLTQFKKVINETKATHAELSSYIADQDRIDQIVTYLEAKGDSVNVPIQIQSVDVSTTKQNAIVLFFDGEGSFSNVINLIWIMENLPYSTEINDISLVSDLANKWKFSMKLEFKINQQTVQ